MSTNEAPVTARIFQPARTAVSSGRFKTRRWVVEFEPHARKEADSLMGWIGSADTDQQVGLTFPSREAAIAYCDARGISYALSEPHARAVRPKAYADNFTRRV